MKTLTNLGVIANVSSTIDSENSEPTKGIFRFNIHINFLNKNIFDLQLERVEFTVLDSLNSEKKLEKDTVIGFTQTLYSGKTLMDKEMVLINSELGLLKGKYYFKNTQNGESVKIDIPEIQLEHLPKLN